MIQIADWKISKEIFRNEPIARKKEIFFFFFLKKGEKKKGKRRRRQRGKEEGKKQCKMGWSRKTEY